MAKPSFNTVVPAPLAHEFAIRDTMKSHNKELLNELRKTSIELEKTGASREEIFNSLYELMTSSHWQAYSSEESTANAGALAIALQENLNRSVRVFEPSTAFDVYSIYSIGLLQGRPLTQIQSAAEQMFVNITCKANMMSVGNHLVFNADVIDMIETAGFSEQVITAIMSSGAGVFYVDNSVKLSKTKDFVSTVFGVPVFSQAVPGRNMKAVRFNFANQENNKYASLAASLFAKGLAAYYTAIEGIKPAQVMELCKDARFKHLPATAVAWVLNKSIVSNNDLWSSMPSGLDKRIDKDEPQEAKKAHFDGQNRAVNNWLHANNIPPYHRLGVPGNLWPVLAEYRQEAVEKGCFTYKVDLPKDPFADWGDTWGALDTTSAPTTEMEVEEESYTSESIPEVDLS